MYSVHLKRFLSDIFSCVFVFWFSERFSCIRYNVKLEQKWYLFRILLETGVNYRILLVLITLLGRFKRFHIITFTICWYIYIYGGYFLSFLPSQTYFLLIFFNPYKFQMWLKVIGLKSLQVSSNHCLKTRVIHCMFPVIINW